jgi:SAM-dependent methyltransferase
VFVEETAPTYLGGMADIVAAMGRVLPLLVESFRTGQGVPYAAYGPDGVSAQSALNRPAFVHQLVNEWLPQLPDVLARLQDRSHPAAVGDFGCGTGWASIELAKAFPWIRITGVDSDETSIALGRHHALDHGVGDRVELAVADLADETVDWSPRFDLVLLAECVHDLPRPVESLRHARASTRPGGVVLVIDERADETFTTPGDEVQRFFAAASPLWCLPQGLVGVDPEPVGTVIRPATMVDLARRAGFRMTTILPIDHPFWRFYRLEP